MSFKKRIVKNTLLQIILNIFNLFAGILSLSLIARYLGKASLGKYSFISSFYFFFFAFLDFGMSTVVLREISRERKKVGLLLSNLLTLKFVLGVALSIIALIIANTFPFPRDLRLAISLYSPILIIIALESVRIIFEADLRYEYIALASFFWRISSLLCVILSIRLNLGLLAIVLSFLLAEGIQYMILSLSSKKFAKIRIPSLDKNLWKETIKAALPLGIAAMFGTMMRNTDVLLLTKLRGFAEVGLYTAAYRIYDISLSIPIALIGSIFPLMSKFYKEDLKTLIKIHQKTFDILSICGMLLMALVLVLAEKIIVLLFGARYIESSIALRILIISSLFVYISIGAGTLIITAGKQRVSMYFFILCAIFNILLNIILIPHFGFKGAAIVNTLTMALLISLSFWFTGTKLKITLSITKLIKAALSCAITILVLLNLKELHLMASIIIGISVYIFLILIMKAIDKEDINSLFEFVKFK